MAEIVPDQPPPPTLAEQCSAAVAKLFSGRLDDLYAKLPENTVRALITFVVLLPYFWLQWTSTDPKAFTVPPSLMSAAGLVTGFYLTGDSSKLMKALLSLTYVALFSAFMWRFGWVPESINTQVTMVMGIYFAKKVVAA